jgi:hypothetical protein
MHTFYRKHLARILAAMVLIVVLSGQPSAPPALTGACVTSASDNCGV